MKTNAARVLDSLNIQYDLRQYEVDPSDLSAETVAAKLRANAAKYPADLVRGSARKYTHYLGEDGIEAVADRRSE